MITSIRVDLILPFFLGIAIHFGKVNLGAEWLSKRLNDKLVSDRLISFGFIRDGKNQRRSRPIDELATNDSIYLEEKWSFVNWAYKHYNWYVADWVSQDLKIVQEVRRHSNRTTDWTVRGSCEQVHQWKRPHSQQKIQQHEVKSISSKNDRLLGKTVGSTWKLETRNRTISGYERWWPHIDKETIWKVAWALWKSGREQSWVEWEKIKGIRIIDWVTSGLT